MPTLVISDLHLGSKFCRYDRLCEWIAGLPDGIELVLNGDIVHAPRPDTREEHLDLLDTLKQMTATRRVVWVAGNHDPECRMADPGNIEFKPTHRIGENIIVAHGHQFEARNLLTGICFLVFRGLYKLHLKLGGPSMHVARYARKFPTFFRVFRSGISANAVQFAKKHGCRTVACGHTHYPEDAVIDGVRYVNTGSWTEEPFCCLFVDDGVMELRKNE